METSRTSMRDNVEADDLMAEAERIHAQVGALKAWFAQHPDMHCLLVIDPSQRDPAAVDAAGNQSFADLPVTAIVVDHDAISPTHCPRLLELDLQTDAGVVALEESVRLAFSDRRPQSMAEGRGQRIGGWLASAASPGEIAAHCSRLLLQRDDRDHLCLLRFYDSRAQALLWPMLSPQQQHALLGPIQAWHTLDAGARPVTRVNTQGRREDFALEPEQWPAIHGHGIVNRALALYAYDRNRQPLPREVEAAAAAAVRARRYGLIDEEDEVVFVCHALNWHPEFDLHPKVLQILGSMTEGDLYAGQIAELTPEEIEEIRQGNWHGRLRVSDSANGRA
ncbi:hypothetical protein F4827_003827 [Paraburkholderia bannensis]|uniref:DUF4123 domain-containing protein n=1 Tax=Paraburkholderia bannensis TaxID=765414 RepID=A0A7W9TYZ8_9BURK|nr:MULTISPECIES: DUF4123 domain-containing protein [Paraburkholderia]MBB3258958.1 hypothetical protein [Paraburkholderia sp. WP4_3_2]MBB6103972.1 hypothetical protein [Paraburkholderia bannensis]